MQTVIVKILDERALGKLEELESKKLIKVDSMPKVLEGDWSRFVGSLEKSKLVDLEKELQMLREDWE